jgi:hypothetical protein
VNSIKNSHRDPSGITESWDLWDTQIKKLMEKNDLLADAGEMPETGKRSYGSKSSSDNQTNEGS